MIEFQELRALLIYENAHVGQIVASALQSLGLRDICHVANGVDVLEAVEEAVPDVLIHDVMIGQGDGFEIVRRVRDRSISPNPFLPIIVASGHTEEKYVKAAVNAGAHEFVCFPLSAKSLARRLYSAVFIGRPFVEVKDGYFGPDRRRFDDPSYAGPERRAQAGDSDMAEREASRVAAEDKFVNTLDTTAE